MKSCDKTLEALAIENKIVYCGEQAILKY